MSLCFHRCTALVLLTLFLAVLVLAGTGGKIAGKITDKATGEPLVGVNVTVKTLKLGASTDANGEYFILNVPPGVHSVGISLLGYEPVSTTGVVVIVDRTSTVDAALNVSLIEVGAVTVTAERPVVDKNLTASEQVVTGSTLENAGFRTVKEALETQTGIFADNSNLAWQRGGTKAYVRGSSAVQSVYMLDNLSVNSGLVSDNYSGFNTSTVEQISVQTGGYNAEYGEGRSAVVNIVSKESPTGLHGSVIYRIRPAGVYHFGRNIYSHENNDYLSTGIDYWAAQSADENSVYYGLNADSLLGAWRRQSTPNSTMGKYADRPDWETEGTLYGGVTDDLSFLASGRYHEGVGIFPQAIPYNPEYNFQGYLNYKFSESVKARVGGFVGGYESADYTSSNMNTSEYGQESGWLAPMRIDEQYARAKYNLPGAPYRQWPEKRKWSQFYAKVTDILNTRSFFEVTASYLKDNLDRSDRYDQLPDTLWLPDVVSMVPRYTLQAYYHTWTQSLSESYQLKGDYTNQLSQSNNLKTGFTLKSYSFHYENYAAASGSSRTNDMNVFDGTPYEGSLYVQDKLETPGLIVNGGVRVDFFNQNRDAPANRYDPLAFELTTPGHDPADPNGIPGTPERVPTKLQAVIAPRLGISHPISESTVLHFVYGHFYQRPSWVKMFGFPFVNYTTVPDSVMDPYAKQTTYMDEWQGYYGNPDLGYERTIQYELGVDCNIANKFRLDMTGYYKDASLEADVVTGVYSASHPATKALMVSNSGYSDVRGIETKLDSRFDGPINFGLSHEVYWSFNGEVGFSRLYEEGSQSIDVPKGLRQEPGAWGDYQRIKWWASYTLNKGEGPEMFGVHPLSDFHVYANGWWRTGDQFTYHPQGDVSTEPNNMRWDNYYQIDMNIGKAFDIYGMRTEFSLDIKNVLNSKFLRLLDGDDLVYYMEHPSLPDEQRLPKTVDFPEPNKWEWYSYEVAPRRMYFQVKVDL